MIWYLWNCWFFFFLPGEGNRGIKIGLCSLFFSLCFYLVHAFNFFISLSLFLFGSVIELYFSMLRCSFWSDNRMLF